MRPVLAPQSIEHALAFAAAGALFAVAHELRLAGVIVAAIAYPLLIEVVQIVIPGRHARISDFLVDAAGAVLGSAIGYKLRQTATLRDGLSFQSSQEGRGACQRHPRSRLVRQITPQFPPLHRRPWWRRPVG